MWHWLERYKIALLGESLKCNDEETKVLNFNFLNCVIFILFIIINLLNGKK